MAELLIRVNSSSHPDPAVDAGCYKRGDVVVVMPDGHRWGTQEGLPVFVKVKIPGLSVATAMAWLQERLDTTDPLKPRLLRRRLWNIAVSDIPQAIRTALLTDGEATVTLTQVRSYIRNTVTLETA